MKNTWWQRLLQFGCLFFIIVDNKGVQETAASKLEFDVFFVVLDDDG